MCSVLLFVISKQITIAFFFKAHDGSGKDEKWRLQQVRIRCKMEVDRVGMENGGVNGEQSAK